MYKSQQKVIDLGTGTKEIYYSLDLNHNMSTTLRGGTSYKINGEIKVKGKKIQSLISSNYYKSKGIYNRLMFKKYSTLFFNR